MVHRRSFAWLLLIALLVPILVACGGGEATPSGSPAASTAASPATSASPAASPSESPAASAAATTEATTEATTSAEASPAATTAGTTETETAATGTTAGGDTSLIGADPSADTAPAVPNAEQAKQYSGTTITYYGDTVGIGATLDKALADRFTQDTGINVNIVPKPQNATENYATYQRLFQAQSGDIDVLMVDVIWPGAFAPHLADLTQAMSEEAGQHYEGIIQNNTIDGKLVAMPWFGDFGMLYYRTDLLQKYNFSEPPKTWDELEEMARTIQEGERASTPDFQGFVFQGNAYEGLTCDALEWLASTGAGTIIDENGQVNVNNPEAVAILNKVRGWVGTISPRGVTGYGEEEARNTFQGGLAAFMRNWPYAYSAGNADDSPIKGKFDVAPLPAAEGQQPAGTVGGWQLAVSNYSQNKEAAIEFVRYMTGPEVQTYRALIGSYVPTIATVAEDPAVIEAMPFLENLADVQRVTRPSATTGERYNEVSTAFFQGVNQILNGQDAAQVLPGVQQRIERIAQ